MRRLAAVLLFGASMLALAWFLQPPATFAEAESQLPELISIRDLFANLGFTRLDSAEVEDAPTLWEMPVTSHVRRPTRIARKERSG